MNSPTGSTSTAELDARRTKSQQRSSQADRAQAAMTAAETALRDCDQRIDAHRAAISSHKRGLETSKDERAGLVAARKQRLKELSRSNARAAKAEHRYDKAVLAHIVDDAKDADQALAARRSTPPASAVPTKTAKSTAPAAKRAGTTAPRTTNARKGTPRKGTPRKTTARKTVPRKSTSRSSAHTPPATAL